MDKFNFDQIEESRLMSYQVENKPVFQNKVKAQLVELDAQIICQRRQS